MSKAAVMTFSDSFTKAQQLSGVSLGTFIASVSLSVCIFLVQVLLFLGIRRQFPRLYVTHPSQQANRKFLRLDDKVTHLDRYFFRRYIRTLCVLFIVSATFITPVLVPLNFYNGKNSGLGVSGLDVLGWSNVGLDHCDRYWAHLVLSWLFVGFVCALIWVELAHYVYIRQNAPCATLRTVLIDAIPHEWMDKTVLSAQFDRFPGGVADISFNKDLRALSKAVTRREQLAACLEAAITRHVRTEVRMRKSYAQRSVDHHAQSSHVLLTNQISSYLEQLRNACEQAEVLKTTAGNLPLLHSAFVTFNDPVAASMVCQIVIHPKPGFLTPRTLIMTPEDVVWDNVSIPWWSRTIRTVVCNVLISGIALACIVPMAFIGLLSQVIYLTQAVEWLSWISNLPQWTLRLLQGVLPPTLLAMIVKGFLVALKYLIRKQGIATKTGIDRKLQDYYFHFLFIQITLVVSLSAGVTTITNEMASGAALAATLAKNLPKASNYFLSYIVLQSLSVAANALLRADRLAELLLIAPISDRTVSRMMARQMGRDLQWGEFLPLYSNLSCIGFLYAIVSPIILPFQALIFTLFWVIHSTSTMTYTKTDTGGSFYPIAIKHLVSGLYVMEVSLGCLFVLVRDADGRAMCLGQACLVAVTIPLTMVYHHVLNKVFGPLLVPISLTASSNISAKGLQVSSPFQHEDVARSSIVRLPRDAHGLSLAKAAEMRAEIRDIEIDVDGATLSAAGKIRLSK